MLTSVGNSLQKPDLRCGHFLRIFSGSNIIIENTFTDCSAILSDFTVFYQNKQDARRPHEYFCGGLAPRSLFWELMVKKTLTKKQTLLPC